MTSLCLANAHVLASADEDPVLSNVYIEDGKIGQVDSASEPLQATDECLDCSHHVVIPGLANLHLHSRPGRALSDGLPVHIWHKRIDKLSHVMSPEDAYVGALVAFGEMVLGGITSAMVMTRHFEHAAKAAAEIGVRAVSVPLAGDTEAVSRGELDDLQTDLDLIRAQDRSSGRIVTLWPGFDSPLTTSAEGMKQVAGTAKELGLGLHTHMAESQHEVETFRQRHGVAEGEALERAGLLRDRSVIAHCNWLEDSDFARFSQHRVTVVHNPVSNMRFASGVCQVGRLHDSGINVALGTDGMLSGYQLNMFDAMRAAVMLQRISLNSSSALDVREVFRMATENGASVWDGGVGRIRVGAPADLAVINMQGLHVQPYRRNSLNDQDLFNLVVWCARPSDVQHVICDGKVRVRDWELTAISSESIRGRSIAVDQRIRPLIGESVSPE